MPQGKGTYGSQVGRPPKKSSGFKMKRGSNPNFKKLGSTPNDTPLEKFDWGSAIGGAVKGAKAGSAAGPWGIVAGALGGGALGGFAGGAQEDQEAAAMDEEKKNAIVAEELKRKKETASIGYSGFNAENS